MPLLSKQLGDRSRSSASEVWYDCGTGVRPSGGLEGESELVDGCYDRERTSLSFKMRCSGSRPFSGVMMGSRMASASRVVQVVKTYTPLRRFPNRRDHPKPNVWEVLRSAGLPSHSSSVSQHFKGSKSPDWLMHQGPPDTRNNKNITSEI